MAKKRILVIEDVPEVLRGLVIRLERAGYEVITATDGEEGLRKARDLSPDLVLLDLMLPKMDGYKVCRLLKFDEEYQHIPVLILSARAMERDKARGFETGADAYITKPYDSKTLLTTIERLLDHTYVPGNLHGAAKNNPQFTGDSTPEKR